MNAEGTSEETIRDMAVFTDVLIEYHTGNLPCDTRVTAEEDILLSSFVDISIASQNQYSLDSALEDTADLMDAGSSNIDDIYEMALSPLLEPEHSAKTDTPRDAYPYQHNISTEYRTDNAQSGGANELYIANQDVHTKINNNNNSFIHLTQPLSAEHHIQELSDGALTGSNYWDAFLPMAVLELKISNENLLLFISQLANSVDMDFSSEWFSEEYMLLQMYTAMRKVYSNTEELKMCEKSSVCLYRSCCAYLDRAVKSFFGFNIRFLSNGPTIESTKLLQNGAVTVTFERPLQECDIEALLKHGFLYEGISSANNEEQVTSL